MKVICMIPARMGSKRIPKKNIRILYDKPLIAWAILAAKNANCFDEIWVNGDDEIFGDIAKEYGVLYYHRPAILGTDAATNDDFMYDFLQCNDCDAVVQLLPTSPFVQPQFVKFFYDEIKNPNNAHRDALISVKEIKIECLYRFEPINYNAQEKTKPSQELTPVMAYACSPMAWKKKAFMEYYKINLGAYHANGNANLIRVAGYAAVDIDTEEDWKMAEVIAAAMQQVPCAPQYYVPGLVKGIEADVPSILKKDGVQDNDLFNVNNLWFNINQHLLSATFESWSKRIIDSPSNSVTLIHQNKGEGNRRHFHYNWDEWWYIISGKWEFEIEGNKHIIKTGDVVFIGRGKIHRIIALENGSIRMAVSRADIAHVYV